MVLFSKADLRKRAPGNQPQAAWRAPTAAVNLRAVGVCEREASLLFIAIALRSLETSSGDAKKVQKQKPTKVTVTVTVAL
jgi:hypothetical protein